MDWQFESMKIERLDKATNGGFDTIETHGVPVRGVLWVALRLVRCNGASAKVKRLNVSTGGRWCGPKSSPCGNATNTP